MKAALYIRVSTSEQALHGYSLPAQEALLREYAEQHEMQVYNVYADEGVSAAKALTKRKALLAMLDDAEQGKFQCILFKDITRWSRSSKNYWTIQDRLDKCKVGWISVQQPYLETLTPTGRFQVSIMLGTAQLESEQTGERVKFVQDSLVKQGYYPFAEFCVPFGMECEKVNGHPKLVPGEDAEKVREIFRIFLDNGNINQTAETVGMNYLHVRDILRNRIYIGEFRGVPHFCEPVITESEFNIAQSLTKHKSYTVRHRGSYTFSSLGRCYCGGSLAAQRPNHGKAIYYQCNKCKHNGIAEKALEEAFLDRMEEFLGEMEIEVKPQRNPSRDAKTRAKLMEKMDRLNELYIDGNISKKDYNEKKTSLEAQISVLTPRPRKLPKEFKGDWKTAYRALDSQRRNVLWKTVCKGYVLNQDKTVSIFFVH